LLEERLPDAGAAIDRGRLIRLDEAVALALALDARRD
jgi:hypothetical protein